MFKFLKDKIKGAIEKISKKVEQEAPSKEVEVEGPISEKIKEEQKVEEKQEKPEKEKKPKKKGIKEEVPELKHETHQTQLDVTELEKAQEIKPEPIEEKKEKHGFFYFLKKKREEEKQEPILGQAQIEEKRGLFQVIKEKATTKVINEKQFDDIFFDLEFSLLENNVAVEVIEKIKNDLKKNLTNKPIKRDKVAEEIKNSLKNSIEGLFNIEQIDLTKKIKEKIEKPFVIVFFGINGSGKTSTISKIAYMLKRQGISSVMVAGDTFRKGSIEQLEEHGRKLGIKVIKQQYESDPAAVSFDGVSFGKAHNIDVVLIDTAGRMHSNVNLMDQMKKIVRVAKPDLKIFIGESITGNDAIEQAKSFNDAIGIDCIILTKADVDERGGAMISISYVTHKPILYLGNGQRLDDLEIFNKEKIISNLGL